MAIGNHLRITQVVDYRLFSLTLRPVWLNMGGRRLILDEIYTVGEVAEMLKVSTATVRKLVKDGDLRILKVGSRWRIPESSIRKFVQRGTDNG